MPHFDIVGEIANQETFAKGLGIRELKTLKRLYGGRNWRKRKGEAMIALPGDRIRRAELHWYEAHGVGKVQIKRVRYLD